MSKEFKKASEIISTLFNGLNINQMEQSNLFIKNWKEIVGDKIASHSSIIDVDRGVVIVEVDHPGWSQQIQFKKKQILYNLSKNFPELNIKNLVMRVSTICDTPYVKQTVEVGSGIPRIEENNTENEVPSNMNDDLRVLFEKLKKSIKKGKPTS